MSSSSDQPTKKVIYQGNVGDVPVVICAEPDIDPNSTDFVCSIGNVTWRIESDCNVESISFDHSEGESVIDFASGKIESDKKKYTTRVTAKGREKYKIELSIGKCGPGDNIVTINPYISCN